MDPRRRSKGQHPERHDLHPVFRKQPSEKSELAARDEVDEDAREQRSWLHEDVSLPRPSRNARGEERRHGGRQVISDVEKSVASQPNLASHASVQPAQVPLDFDFRMSALPFCKFGLECLNQRKKPSRLVGTQLAILERIRDMLL